MILADTRIARVSEAIGNGVFATQRIPRGTIVWTQDPLDQVWTPDQASRLAGPPRENLERYAHRDAQGNYILCWDAGKLINHSCEPSLRGVGPWFQVARRDLAPGEELTCDYAECNIDAALSCDCGAASCRRQIHGRDLREYTSQWDAEAAGLLSDVRRVAQPLWPHLLDATLAQAWLDGMVALPSFADLCAFPVSPSAQAAPEPAGIADH